MKSNPESCIVEVIQIALKDISPSQSDDGRYSECWSPISVYRGDGTWRIQHGNHRYFRALDVLGQEGLIPAKVVSNPYLDF